MSSSVYPPDENAVLFALSTIYTGGGGASIYVQTMDRRSGINSDIITLGAVAV